jgi:hypothetical protein
VRLVYVLTEVGLGLSLCAVPLPILVPYFRLSGRDREDQTKSERPEYNSGSAELKEVEDRVRLSGAKEEGGLRKKG